MLSYLLLDYSLCWSVIRNLWNTSKKTRKLVTWIHVFNRIHIMEITHIMIRRCFDSKMQLECSHQKVCRVKQVASFEIDFCQILSAFELMAFKYWTKTKIPVDETPCLESWQITRNWIQHKTFEMMHFFPLLTRPSRECLNKKFNPVSWRHYNTKE